MAMKGKKRLGYADRPLSRVMLRRIARAVREGQPFAAQFVERFGLAEAITKLTGKAR